MHLYKYGPYSEQNAKFNNKHVNSIRRWRIASVSLIKTSEKMLSPDTTLVTIRLHHIFDTFDTTPKCIPVIYRWEIAKQRNNTFRNFTSMYARRMNIWSMKKMWNATYIFLSHQISEFALPQSIPWIFQREGVSLTGDGDHAFRFAPTVPITTAVRIGAAATWSRQITNLLLLLFASSVELVQTEAIDINAIRTYPSRTIHSIRVSLFPRP